MKDKYLFHISYEDLGNIVEWVSLMNYNFCKNWENGVRLFTLDRAQMMSLLGCHSFRFIVLFYNEETFVKISYNNKFIIYSGRQRNITDKGR